MTALAGLPHRSRYGYVYYNAQEVSALSKASRSAQVPERPSE